MVRVPFRASCESVHNEIARRRTTGSDDEFHRLPAAGAATMIGATVSRSIDPLVHIAAGELHPKKRSRMGAWRFIGLIQPGNIQFVIR